MTGTPSRSSNRSSLPALAGIGLRPPHIGQVLSERPALGWLEVHSENYFSPGGVPAHVLERVRENYALSLHGVGLSLGSTDALDQTHLARLKASITRYQPALVSEHLCWSSISGHYLNDLLPLPYTREALDHVISRIGQVQDFLGRTLLVENISSYLDYTHAEIPEWEFLRELAQRSGCDLLLDVNNVYVSSHNHGFDAHAYLREIPAEKVKEIHLAGHTRVAVEGGEILIDSHDQRVCPDVWALFEFAIDRYGPTPTLIEWDSDLPALSVLDDERRRANNVLEARDVEPA